MLRALTSVCDYLSRRRRPPSPSTFRRNRVDAYPNLLIYHDPADGRKPRPSATQLLPLRTLIPTTSFLDKMHMAQTQAYYEEIDDIQAVAVGVESPFAHKHWYIIHPLLPTEVRALSTRVMEELRIWIEGSESMYIGEVAQVLEFKAARQETLDLVKKELERRGFTAESPQDHGNEICRKELTDHDGYLGKWDDVSSCSHGDDESVKRVGSDEGVRRTEEQSQRQSKTLTNEGLRAAERMAMKMVENIADAEWLDEDLW